MERVRVLFFTSDLGGGGAEKHLVRILNNFDQSRFEVSLALARGQGVLRDEVKTDIPIYSFNVRHVRNAVGSLARLLRKVQPHVLMSIQDHANLAAIVAANIPGNGVKSAVIASVQNPISIDYGRHRSMSKKRMMLALCRRLYPLVDCVIGCSNAVVTDLSELLGSRHPQLVSIHNAGTDSDLDRLAQEAVEEMCFGGSGPILVTVGRLVKQKGYSDLLEAFALLRRTLDAKLVFVGDGPLRGELQERARILNISENTIFLGFRKNPYKYLARADLFVLSSLWEGFGIVIVEAMACGAPVVAIACPGGPAEIIENGVNGILVQPGDIRGLAESMLTVLRNRDLKEHLRLGGYRRARDFSGATIARHHEDLFIAVSKRTMIPQTIVN